MLIIRKEQMEVFEEALLRNFEDEMVQHIKQFTPRHSEIIGEQCVRQVARMGIERARQYGLTNRGPVRFYIELMFMLGSNFDTDPQYPWAGEILNDPGMMDQMQRADRLYDRVMDYAGKVSGPENTYEKEGMRRLSQMRFEDPPTLEGNFENELLKHQNRIHPQKFEYIGETVIHELIQRGNEVAESRAISGSTAASVFIMLMFFFGHGCLTDPQFPWIAGTLSNTSVVNTNEKFEKLYLGMTTFLKHVPGPSEKR